MDPIKKIVINANDLMVFYFILHSVSMMMMMRHEIKIPSSKSKDERAFFFGMPHTFSRATFFITHF